MRSGVCFVTAFAGQHAAADCLPIDPKVERVESNHIAITETLRLGMATQGSGRVGCDRGINLQLVTDHIRLGTYEVIGSLGVGG